MAKAKGEVAKFLRHVEKQGWTYFMDGSGHFQLRHPSGASAWCSATPGDFRWKIKTMADMKRSLRAHGQIQKTEQKPMTTTPLVKYDLFQTAHKLGTSESVMRSLFATGKLGALAVKSSSGVVYIDAADLEEVRAIYQKTTSPTKTEDALLTVEEVCEQVPCTLASFYQRTSHLPDEQLSAMRTRCGKAYLYQRGIVPLLKDVKQSPAPQPAATMPGTTSVKPPAPAPSALPNQIQMAALALETLMGGGVYQTGGVIYKLVPLSEYLGLQSKVEKIQPGLNWKDVGVELIKKGHTDAGLWAITDMTA